MRGQTFWPVSGIVSPQFVSGAVIASIAWFSLDVVEEEEALYPVEKGLGELIEGEEMRRRNIT